MIKILILLGAPGVGKGTVAQYLSDHYDVYHFSTGNLLRNEVKNGTEIGKSIEKILGTGGLVNDDLVNTIVETNLARVINDGRLIILDGYPRRKEQAVFLDEILNGKLRNFIRVLELTVADDVVVSRISNRKVCEVCGRTYGANDDICSCGGRLIKRADDSEEIIRNRLAEYKSATLPVSNYFADRVVKIDGGVSPEEVAKKVDEVLARFELRKRR